MYPLPILAFKVTVLPGQTLVEPVAFIVAVGSELIVATTAVLVADAQPAALTVSA